MLHANLHPTRASPGPEEEYSGKRTLPEKEGYGWSHAGLVVPPPDFQREDPDGHRHPAGSPAPDPAAYGNWDCLRDRCATPGYTQKNRSTLPVRCVSDWQSGNLLRYLPDLNSEQADTERL